MTNSTKITTPTTENVFQWQGRHDAEDGASGRRVHHVVSPMQANQLDAKTKAVSLLGFASDAGVARNKGRIGAKQAPDLIRQALANMAWHHESKLFDLGNVVCENDELEYSQSQCADVISAALHATPVITLGGGHEVAWASFQGLADYLNSLELDAAPKVGIINFDAHFDLRAFESDAVDVTPSSGTPFNQIHDYCCQMGWPFHYACLGVSRASNTQTLFERADALGVWYVEDNELSRPNPMYHLTQLQHFIDDCDYLYLTIDLDVFPAATVPGVSAPAARGVSVDTLTPYLERILQEKQKLILADIAEYNPSYDIDNQTARFAARICWDIANAFSEK